MKGKAAPEFDPWIDSQARARTHSRTRSRAYALTRSQKRREITEERPGQEEKTRAAREVRRGEERRGEERRGVGGGGRGAREISGNLEVLADAVGSTRTRCGGGECEEIGRIVAILSTP